MCRVEGPEAIDDGSCKLRTEDCRPLLEPFARPSAVSSPEMVECVCHEGSVFCCLCHKKNQQRSITPASIHTPSFRRLLLTLQSPRLTARLIDDLNLDFLCSRSACAAGASNRKAISRFGRVLGVCRGSARSFKGCLGGDVLFEVMLPDPANNIKTVPRREHEKKTDDKRGTHWGNTISSVFLSRVRIRSVLALNRCIRSCLPPPVAPSSLLSVLSTSSESQSGQKSARRMGSMRRSASSMP